ncbi:MAG: redox-regulated molecular chaperone Hsp33, partial [Alteromonas sp.]|nr:redox-regulated molecular chaperone Hsp33 [Alteromonas sp.]
MNQFDQLHRYLFTDASVRGELVRLQDTLKPIVHSTDYPLAIQQLLAEMAAATSLLTATLKFEGEVGLQIQSQGKVRYAVVNATHEQTLRGVARWDEEADLSTASFAELVANAVLVITITPTEGERYQGVVALDKGSLAGCIEDYFERSEQLATRVFIHTDLADKDAPKVAGMFLQVVPTSSEATNVTADSEFEHLCTLTETMT